jgi:hypothetical protein
MTTTEIITLAISAFLGALLTGIGFIWSVSIIGRRGKHMNITVKLPDGDKTINTSLAKPDEIADLLNKVQEIGKRHPSA